MKLSLCLMLLVSLLLFPFDTYAYGSVQLVQGKCPQPDQIVSTSSVDGLSPKAMNLLSGLMAHRHDAKTWQIVSIKKLKKNSHYYSPAVKTCKREIAKHSYLVDIFITKKSSTLPERMHFFAVKESKGWKLWGIASY